jgi:CheY-like chemotaxis protein
MLRIMLVEDNSADARLTGEILKESNIEHELVWINDGRKALDHIASDGDFDLFILDLNMPKASGLEVLSKIRTMERFRSTPVIVMTGSILASDRTMMEGEENLHFLVKPMTMEEIDRMVIDIKKIILDSSHSG